jgi:thiamine-monophosphate kinase
MNLASALPPVFLADADARAREGPVTTAGEFDLIARHFTRPVRHAALGVGDDCALLPAPQAGMQWAVSSDMLVEGRHFLSTVSPRRLGHKALAVNLSDLAACGARPLAFTLALAMPRADEGFAAELAAGIAALADQAQIDWVGGDTTAGPLNLCITVIGEVPQGQALLRSGARAGDEIWVSGPLGDARLALEVFRGHVALDAAAFEAVRRAMEQPQPRWVLGQALRGLASAAIDLSDGLLGDLGHVLRRSGVGAVLRWDDLPRSPILAALPATLQAQCLLAGGDDYELLFTAPPAAHAAVRAAGQACGAPVQAIGHVCEAPGLRVLDAEGQAMPLAPWRSFDHFAGDGT